MLKKILGTAVAAALIGLPAANAAVSELTPEEAAVYRTQMDANIQAVKTEQMRIEAEAAARAEARRQAAEKAALERAKAERIRAQRQAELAKAKAARQKKLDGYADQERELSLELKRLEVDAKRAQVENAVAQDKARAELARDKAQLELEELRAKIRILEAQSIAKP